MGYSEVLCRICGVSFNISRFRKEGEPREAAWQNTGDAVSPFVDRVSEPLEVECVRNGCYFIRRLPQDQAQEGSEERWPPPDSKYASPDYDPDEDEDTDDADLPNLEEFEHIAGPDCTQGNGYNGALISFEAMKRCTTLQCLVPKAAGWTPAADDEPLEAEGDFFLSGLSDHMMSRDTGYPRVYPTRHGCEMPMADTCFFVSGMEDQVAMPFHPTCLEIFKRASMNHSGAVDIPGLTGFFRCESSYDDVYGFPWDRAVRAGKSQWWMHNSGDEFLAANPCFVPEISSIVSKVRRDPSTTRADVTTDAATEDVSGDLFLRLPYDIRHSIALLLTFKDLPNLRCASGAFRGLPQSLFYAMLRREMPWFYEAWCELPLSRWATTTAASLREGEWAEDVIMEPLDRATNDWEALGAELSQNGMTVLGLRNRRRIWKDCEEILRRIDEHRSEGRIKARTS